MTRERLKVFHEFVAGLASLSKCSDKKQAAIIVDEDLTQVYSIGLNGGPKHGEDCLCRLGGKYTCIHAEAQALAKAHCDVTGCTMICTMSPCVTCASLIVNSGIKRFIYCSEYKDATGVKIMKAAGVEVHSIHNLRVLLPSKNTKHA